eukprot:m.109428 g.109428  ORF g.109428 m.109428 type:complete len:360 (-) comp15342_c0_seq3:601-1680(-)
MVLTRLLVLLVIQITFLPPAMSSTMKAIHFDEPGDADVLVIKDGVPVPTPAADEVLIRVVASAINRADTLQRRGRYPVPPGACTTLGLEASGIVTAVGKDVSSVNVGDRVMALLEGGGYAEYCTTAASQVLVLPKSFDLTTAGAIMETWLTAFQLLYLVADLKQGQTVLVHAGGSGVGLAAVQLVTKAGAKAIVTAGSQAKIDQAVALGAIGGVNRHEGPWLDAVLKLNEDQPVNIVLDCVGSAYWEANTDVLAVDGTWVLYGLMSGADVEGNLLARLLRKRIHLRATTLRSRSKSYKARLVEEFAEKALPSVLDGSFRIIVDKMFPLAQAGEAHAHMEQNANTGKIVLSVSELGHEEL